jgi:hypothetical protein
MPASTHRGPSRGQSRGHTTRLTSTEEIARAAGGWPMLLFNLGLLLGSIAWMVSTLVAVQEMPAGEIAWKLAAAVLLEGSC